MTSKVIALLCLVLSLNFISPVFASANPISGQVPVCTSQGLVWVEAGSADTAPKSGFKHCIYCLNTDDDEATLIKSTQIKATQKIHSIFFVKPIQTAKEPQLNQQARSPPISL